MRERRLPGSFKVKVFRDLKAVFCNEGSISIVSITDKLMNSVVFNGSREVALFFITKFRMSYMGISRRPEKQLAMHELYHECQDSVPSILCPFL